jgi:hypothetical protein
VSFGGPDNQPDFDIGGNLLSNKDFMAIFGCRMGEFAGSKSDA